MDVSSRAGESAGSIGGAAIGADDESRPARCGAADGFAVRTPRSTEVPLRKFGIVRGVGDRWAVSAARFWPQHMVQISLRRLRSGLDDCRFTTQPLEKTGTA